MGVTKNEAVIAIGRPSDAEAIIRFREQMPEQYRHLLVVPVSCANAISSFALLPNGSNEGGTTSNEMDSVRAG